MDPQLLKFIADYSPALAAGVVVTIGIVVTLLKLLGFSGIADKSKLVDETKLAAVNTGITQIKNQISGVEKRLVTVEHDITNRPTREEMHRLELAFTRLEGETRSQGMTIQSTASAIGRIEDYMYQAAATRRGQGQG